MIRWLRQRLCWATTGHDRLVHFEGAIVMLRCRHCEHDTPGWAIDGRPPRKRFDGDPRRHRLTRLRRVS